MKRVIGLVMFSLGVGMVLALVLPKVWLTLLIAGALLIAGYQLFCCDK
ncbi:MAG: hypothetical protein PUB22_02005 [Clostridiales bacterium]|nr:hypothetical protein [Clostridiales bacterium]